MSKIEKTEIFRKETEKGMNYMMFVEYNGLRFAKPWILTKDAKLSPTDVAEIMLVNAQEELDEYWSSLKNVGEPVEWPLPEWISSWERFEL